MAWKLHSLQNIAVVLVEELVSAQNMMVSQGKDLRELVVSFILNGIKIDLVKVVAIT